MNYLTFCWKPDELKSSQQLYYLNWSQMELNLVKTKKKSNFYINYQIIECEPNTTQCPGYQQFCYEAKFLIFAFLWVDIGNTSDFYLVYRFFLQKLPSFLFCDKVTFRIVEFSLFFIFGSLLSLIHSSHPEQLPFLWNGTKVVSDKQCST